MPKWRRIGVKEPEVPPFAVSRIEFHLFEESGKWNPKSQSLWMEVDRSYSLMAFVQFSFYSMALESAEWIAAVIIGMGMDHGAS